MERYRKNEFYGTPRYPNRIPNDIREKCQGNNTITDEDHLRCFIDVIEEYEIEDEDGMMKFFVQSLEESKK